MDYFFFSGFQIWFRTGCIQIILRGKCTSTVFCPPPCFLVQGMGRKKTTVWKYRNAKADFHTELLEIFFLKINTDFFSRGTNKPRSCSKWQRRQVWTGARLMWAWGTRSWRREQGGGHRRQGWRWTGDVDTERQAHPMLCVVRDGGFPSTSQRKEKTLRYRQRGLLKKGRQRLCLQNIQGGSPIT